ATDLARLYVLKNYLLQGYEQVVWLDADFLVFDPEEFVLPTSQYAFGREVWVQKDNSGKLRAYKKIHNAFMMFNKGNSFLDFYIETAERLLWKNTGSIPPQFIGPKLLTALHNIALFPVMEEAAMLSPLVVKDIIKGAGTALDMFIAQSPSKISGANLCVSSCERGELVENEIQHLITRLRSGEHIC
ncbi:MAG: hypothetical protein OEY52_16670, partial [Gammaproteobacteria bacterium]|nr:hypothetical protein [Gammaproteobacteria bacterium]